MKAKKWPSCAQERLQDEVSFFFTPLFQTAKVCVGHCTHGWSGLIEEIGQHSHYQIVSIPLPHKKVQSRSVQ